MIPTTTIDDTVQDEPDKLGILINRISSDVYDHFATFESTVNRLKVLYVKPTNGIFARHVLVTRGQRENKDIDGYVQLPAKEFCFKAFNADRNRNDRFRNAFIIGIRFQFHSTVSFRKQRP